MKNNIKDILEQHKNLLRELQNEVNILENSDVLKENAMLQGNILKIEKQLNELEVQNQKITSENFQLKSALYEQIYNQKISLLNFEKKRLNILFKMDEETSQNGLEALKCGAKMKLFSLREKLAKNKIELADEIQKSITETEKLVEQKIFELKEKVTEENFHLAQEQNQKFKSLYEEQLDELQIKSLLKKNNIESIVGLNILNKVGIAFLILATIFASRLNFMKTSPTVQFVYLFLIGIGVLGIGEFLNRKKSNIFSLGVVSAGCAMLYINLSMGYFYSHVIGNYIALLLCVLITAVVYVLSKFYNSQTIATFSIIGGYLPILLIDKNILLINYLMIYFTFITAMNLIISMRKKWDILFYVGLVLNLASLNYIIKIETNLSMTLTAKIILLLYIIINTIIYFAIPILALKASKGKFQLRDSILLAINTLYSCGALYYLINNFGWKKYNGLLAILFIIIYVGLAEIIEKKFPEEKKTQVLFYLTGMAFVILVIPFQFGEKWLSIGWLLEGTILILYGILYNEKNFERVGYVINVFCLLAFFIYDIFSYDYTYNLLIVKYTTITFCTIIILLTYIYKKYFTSKYFIFLKKIAIINFSIYIISIVNFIFKKLDLYYDQFYYHDNLGYLETALIFSLLLLLAYFIPRIKNLSDEFTKYYSYIIYGISFVGIFLNNFRDVVTYSPSYGQNSDSLKIIEAPISFKIIASIIILFFTVWAIIALSNFIKNLILNNYIRIESYILIVSGYFLVLLLQRLIIQFDLSITSLFISIIILFFAVGWIIYGFIKYFGYVRRAGLICAVIAIAKLFIVDLSFLSLGYKVLSYIIFGLILMGISFVYQYYDKRLYAQFDLKNKNEEK